MTDVRNGFSVEGPREAEEDSHIKLKCSASHSDYANVTWYKHDPALGDVELVGNRGPEDERRDGMGSFKVTMTSTQWSLSKEITFQKVELVNRGRYLCRVDVRPEAMPGNGAMDDDGAAGGPASSALSSSFSNRYYNDQDGGGSRRTKRKQEELSLDLRVLELRKPALSVTNMWDNRTVVEEAEDGLRLVCQTTGRPKPKVEWVLNGKPVQTTVNTTRVALADDGQELQISYLTEAYEGIYQCVVTNKVGQIKARQLVQLRSTVEADERFSTMSYPVVIAVIASIILVLLLVALAKLFYSNRRLRHRKNAPLPPTPPQSRMRQYALPHERDGACGVEDCASSSGVGGCSVDPDDECRVTLTSAAALNHAAHHHDAGSLSHYGHCGGPGSTTGSLLSPQPLLPMAHYCHCGHYGCSSPAPSHTGTLNRHHMPGTLSTHCSVCDYGPSPAPPPMQPTLPINRYFN